MKVLIACEESQVICKAFRDKGNIAYSCDLLPCSGGFPQWHIMDNVINILNDDWDLIIAHPPCTYLSNAGARWLYQNHRLNNERYLKGIAAKEFFMKFYNCDCKYIAIENPIPAKIYNLPKYSQVIEPYEYGDPFSKRTCLWLKNLPPLIPTYILVEYVPYVSSGSYSKSHNKKYSGVSRSGGSSRIRSKSFNGIAAAMADQWTYYIEKR